MPFEIRIIDKINPTANLVEFGIIPEPLMTLNSNFHPKSIGLIEMELYSTYKFNVGKTWFPEYDNLCYKFYQDLIINMPHTDFGELYIIGTLVGEQPRPVKLYLGENDETPKDIKLPFIPKTDEDFVSYDGNVYRTKNVIYKNGEIALIVEEYFDSTIAEFEKIFFRRNT